MDDALTLRRRLAETIAWCEPRFAPGDPANSLRTPELLPAGLTSARTTDGYTMMELELYSLPAPAARAAVDHVAATRSRLLQASNVEPAQLTLPLRPKSILAYAPYENLADGTAKS